MNKYSKGDIYNAMNFVNYITTVLLSLQPPYGDGETWQQRSDRMAIVAEAIDDASSRATCSDKYESDKKCVRTWQKDKKSIALLLVTMGYWESKFAKNVHEGKCKKYECDPSISADGSVYHKARSPWQIQKTGLESKEEYAKMKSASLESTTISANVATRHLVLGMKQCGSIHGAMAIYGGASSCAWPGVSARETFYNDLTKKPEEQLLGEVEKRKISLEKSLAEKEEAALKDKKVIPGEKTK